MPMEALIAEFSARAPGSTDSPADYFLLAEALRDTPLDRLAADSAAWRQAIAAFTPDLARRLAAELDLCLGSTPGQPTNDQPELSPPAGPPARSGPPPAQDTLAEIGRLLSRPDQTRLAYELARRFLEQRDPAELAALREDWTRLADGFLPKRRRELNTLFAGRAAPLPPGGDDPTESGEDGLDTATLTDIEDLAETPALRLDACLWLSYELAHADPERLNPLRPRLEALIDRFGPAERSALRRLLPPGPEPPPPPPGETPVPASPTALAAPPPPDPDPTPPTDGLTEACDDAIHSGSFDETVAGYRITRHALRRLGERTTPLAAVDMAIRFGRRVHMNHAEFFIVGRKEVARHRGQPGLERLMGLHVVCSGGHVITAYKNQRVQRAGGRRRAPRR